MLTQVDNYAVGIKTPNPYNFVIKMSLLYRTLSVMKKNSTLLQNF